VSPAALLTALGLALAALEPHAEPIDVRDDDGVQLVLPAPARRVITLAPSLTELMFVIGAEARLVGADTGSDYPQAALAVPRIGDFNGIDLERVLLLRPDLVLRWSSGNKQGDLVRLRKLAIPVFSSEPRLLDDVPRNLRMLGLLTDSQAAAQTQATLFERRLAAIRKRHRQGRMLSVFVEVWHQPLMTVNGAHLVSDVLQTCGARNIFADLQTLSGPVALERLLVANPDAIVSATGFGDDVGSWQRWRSVRAVETGRILQIDPNELMRATPRILDATERICEWLESLR
jgi:iron complex transport system substrate-binding protein